MSARDAANVTDNCTVTLERDPAPPVAPVCPKCGSAEVVFEGADKLCKIETCKFRWSSNKD